MNPALAKSIVMLGGDPVDPSTYESTESDWQTYLENGGVRFFSASEFCNHVAKCGFDRSRAVPPSDLMPSSLLVLLAADRLRHTLGEPISGIWCYRDTEINAARKGAKCSDHLKAAAVDLLFESKDQLTRILPLVWSLFGEEIFEPSVGLGNTKIHLGLRAGRDERFWRY